MKKCRESNIDQKTADDIIYSCRQQTLTQCLAPLGGHAGDHPQKIRKWKGKGCVPSFGTLGWVRRLVRGMPCCFSNFLAMPTAPIFLLGYRLLEPTKLLWHDTPATCCFGGMQSRSALLSSSLDNLLLLSGSAPLRWNGERCCVTFEVIHTRSLRTSRSPHHQRTSWFSENLLSY